MDKSLLESYVNQGLSTHKISKLTTKSQTTIRYWLKKYGLETNLSKSSNSCIICNEPLKKRRRFCSESCRQKTKNKKHQRYTCQQNRGHKRKIELVNLAGGKCLKCGYNKNYSALQFHHINPEEKEDSLDIRVLSTKNWEWCLNELKKCQLLCSNCHFEHHNPRFNTFFKEPN